MNDGHRRDEPYRALPPPRGVLKKVLSLPVVLERHGLGRILGNRFIIIEHVGRSSGRVYRTPVEVVAHDSDGEQSWTVVAAWDAHPDWLANIEHRDARAVIVAGRRHEHPTQQRLDPVTACDVLAAYVCRYPLVARALFRVLHWPDPRRPGAFREITATVPMVRFRAEARPATG
jgi:deazaflavin-dependent oxidoreductase (nitroreductase family)